MLILNVITKMDKKSILKMLLVGGFIFSMVQTAFAQEKISIGILPFTYLKGSTSDEQDVTSIQEEITNAFVKTKRFNVVDRSKMDALKKEKELQKTEDFIDGFVVEQGKSLGAEYLISGHVLAVGASQLIVTDSLGNPHSLGWRAKLSFALKAINVTTGEVIKSEIIGLKSGGSLLSQVITGAFGGIPSKEAAVAKALAEVQWKIDNFVTSIFPITVSIVEFQTDKKVLILGSSDIGVEKGMEFKVYEVSMMDVSGKKIERKKETGKLKISRIEDNNFSIGSITSGYKEIGENFKNNVPLKIIAEVKLKTKNKK
ncbi:curli production assembly/transport component CsgG [Bacteroidia bacterium]|nr:curli production assembly/transport component CsgG [Bacteroidia bacterium]